ncbi:CPBP family intramembrane metalloprotease [Rheinheimera baltica]|uniref:CPBP family intramembrane metalloprotease n=1 Tax=Rheinheimera baltica TaxID=67576 RepID=A0ABT9HTZ7_9GAMM|nr:CPBP family intramembrane glutamic endopeptidase [Rheinheimera baltica]MDP5134599.1 CPBP family intramembrane metalloprotease [Rheinheimera baltica]
MKSDDYSAKSSQQRTAFAAFIAILVFLLMELPIRLVLQPDPWLLDAQHWYFYQPQRLVIELVLVVVLLAVIRFCYQGVLQIKRSQLSLLAGSMLASALLFGLLETEQLLHSFSAGLWLWLAWFCSGFFIGIGQELLYRGLLFTSLHRYMSLGLATAITTIIFVIAPLHSLRLWQYLQQEQFTVVAILIAIYIGVSLLFQWLRNHTGNVVVPALVHGVGNAVTWVAVFA